MRWLQVEYILKGIFLGLLLFVALHEPTWTAVGLSALLTVGGLALALAVAAYRKVREGYQVRGRVFSFILFLLLESPELVSAGILAGMMAAAIYLRRTDADSRVLIGSVAGGAALGIVFGMLRHVRHRWARLGLSLLLAAGLVVAGLFWFGQLGEFGHELGLNNPMEDATIFGAQLLLGLPFFYLLTFAGREEESEIEIGALCAALGLGAWMLTVGHPEISRLQSFSVIVPVMLYLVYTTRILPGLRVFKHAVRGFSYAQIGRHRQAILSFRRALQLDPRNALAREGLWGVHRAMDLSRLADDPETLAVIDLDMCLDRAGSLLLQPSPHADKLQEAHRLLDLVQNQRPAMKPAVRYWRAVAFTHAHRYEEAAEELQALLDPAGQLPVDPQRRAVLLPAWRLALQTGGTAGAELASRVGTPQLAQPGRRMEAIAAVERHLAQNPNDAEVWGFKRVLYQDLTEAEYNAKAGPGQAASDFDHGYVQQLGLALIADPAQWRRGGDYLRLAARGLPAQGPTLFTHIAQAQQREGHPDEAWQSYEQAKRFGQTVGPANLSEEDRQAYFAAVKLLADSALAHNELDLAIENYQLYTASPRSGLETIRNLTELCERKGDPLSALRFTEQGLLYDARDKNLLERKDRYYYSVLPEDLRARLDTVRGAFDVAYCVKKARQLLDAKNWDLDTVDWGLHLAELARVVHPEALAPRLLVARARLRRGEKDEAVALLEEIRSPRPEQFASSEDEEAWYLACKFLGELYLYDLRKPDLAVECFTSFRPSAKSGADTMYRLGQAYEQLGDRVRAVKFYKHVVAYDNHPLAPEAQDALYRLQAN
jgi:tetratricopeptide (TPR) repeat protein